MVKSSGKSSRGKGQGPEVLSVDGREVAVTNPGKILFPERQYTKLDVVRYYLAVADGALRGAGGRPNMLVRYPNGIASEHFYQKRAPESRPSWIEVVSLRFPSGRSADEVVPRDAAALAWLANLGCLELHPHPVRADDLEHPDELRVDLDPVPGVSWQQVRDVAASREPDAPGLRPDRVAQDLGLARHPCKRADRAPVELRSGAARRSGPGTGGGAARSHDRYQQMVEGGAARGIRGLQPERQGPDRGLRLFGPPQARSAGVCSAQLGRGGDL